MFSAAFFCVCSPFSSLVLAVCSAPRAPVQQPPSSPAPPITPGLILCPVLADDVLPVLFWMFPSSLQSTVTWQFCQVGFSHPELPHSCCCWHWLPFLLKPGCRKGLAGRKNYSTGNAEQPGVGAGLERAEGSPVNLDILFSKPKCCLWFQ